MPDFPRVTATVDPAVIWSYSTRTLTEFKGTPRSDLLGEDATFEAGTGARKAVLDRLLAPTSPIEGTLTADGSEQTVVEATGTLEFQLDGYIDLSNMASGDTVVVREYMKIASGGNYVKYAEETYSGAQSIPLLHIVTKPARYALKVTLQQTAGTNRDYPYQFFKRMRTA